MHGKIMHVPLITVKQDKTVKEKATRYRQKLTEYANIYNFDALNTLGTVLFACTNFGVFSE